MKISHKTIYCLSATWIFGNVFMGSIHAFLVGVKRVDFPPKVGSLDNNSRHPERTPKQLIGPTLSLDSFFIIFHRFAATIPPKKKFGALEYFQNL
jgi:hypothetical protein